MGRKGRWLTNRKCDRIAFQVRIPQTGDHELSDQTQKAPNVKTRFIQPALVVVSLLILAFSAYLHYSSLAEADFISLELSLEAPDQENLSVDQQKESKVFIWSILAAMFLLGAIFFVQNPSFSFQAPSLNQRISLLRC